MLTSIFGLISSSSVCQIRSEIITNLILLSRYHRHSEIIKMTTATGRQQLKILVCGDVDGQFDVLLGRLDTSLRKVGPFDLMLVCGEFFGPNQLENQRILTGQLVFPLPTYIIGPGKPEHSRYYSTAAGGELAHNLVFLGRKGYFQTAHGLSVAFLSGLEGEYADDCHFSMDSVRELTTQVTNRPDFRGGVDILLTFQWPKGVDQNSPTSPDVHSEDQLNPSALISKLAADLKPRYHFVSHSARPFERAAYRNHATLLEHAQHTTRFVALARVGNPMKHKYLYAFNIQPMVSMDRLQLVAEPSHTTDFPYAETIKELEEGYALKRAKAALSNSQFFYDIASSGQEQQQRSDQDGGRGDYQRRKRPRTWQEQQEFNSKQQKQQQKPNFGPCWFCLASPEVEKHMVITLGDHAYLALAKGGLVEDHLLILPIGHIQCMAEAGPELKDEVERYKEAMRRFFGDQGKCVVFFERNYRTQHSQIQVVSLPNDRIHNLRATFQRVAEAKNVQLHEVSEQSEISQLVNEGAPYFFAELPYGQKLLATQMRAFPLQFGREVLASPDLLNLPEERIDWKHCALNKEGETEVALKIRQAFAPYDISG